MIDANQSDRALLERWISGRHTEALTELVMRYAPLVERTCRRQCRRRQDVEDAVQMTFLTLANDASKIRHPEALPGWLHRVAHRSACRVRGDRGAANEPLTEDPVVQENLLEQITRRHQIRVVDQELSELPEPYRSALVLHYFEGNTVEEIAKKTASTAGSVRGRLQRGRQSLQKRLIRRGLAVALPTMLVARADAGQIAITPLSLRIADWLPTVTSVPAPRYPVTPAPLRPETMLFGGSWQMNASLILACSVCLSTLIWAVTSSPPTASSAPSRGSVVIPATASEAESETESVATALVAEKTSAPEKVEASAVADSESLDRVKETTSRALNDALLLPVRAEANLLQDAIESLQASMKIPIVIDEAVESDLHNRVELAGDFPHAHLALQLVAEQAHVRFVLADGFLRVVPNYAYRAQHGQQTSQWVSVDEQRMRIIASVLDSTIDDGFNFDAEPLSSVIAMLSQRAGVAIRLDDRALEDISLTPDEPITLSIIDQDATVRDVLGAILEPLDLTYSVNPKSRELTITSNEKANERLLSRIYRLDGLSGIPEPQLNSAKKDHAVDYGYHPVELIQLIEDSVETDNWLENGGAFTISFIPANRDGQRAGLLVHSSYVAHEQLERLFKSLREGPDGSTAPAVSSLSSHDASASTLESIDIDSSRETPAAAPANQKAPSENPFGE